MRTRAERRHNDVTKALRKRKISEEVYTHMPGSTWNWYDNLHQYSKNKIHCSCPLCSVKTKNKGKRRAKDYNKSFNPPASMQKRIDEMDYEIQNEI